jgi:hypothetical protein
VKVSEVRDSSSPAPVEQKKKREDRLLLTLFNDDLHTPGFATATFFNAR